MPKQNQKQTLEEFKSSIFEHAEKNGLRVNPDFKWNKFERIMEREGGYYCPCRPFDLIKCPCPMHMDEIEQDGRCYCNLLWAGE